MAESSQVKCEIIQGPWKGKIVEGDIDNGALVSSEGSIFGPSHYRVIEEPERPRTPQIGRVQFARYASDDKGQLVIWEEVLRLEEKEKHVNEKGGKQTKLNVSSHHIPPLALLKVAEVLDRALESYEEYNWIKIESTEHLNHSLTHTLKAMAYIRDLKTEQLSDELKRDVMSRIIKESSHAATRMLFYLDMLIVEHNKLSMELEEE